MSEPIVEQIAQWVVNAVGEVTTANGYWYDLTVYRPDDEGLDEHEIGDLDTIVVLDDPEAAEPISTPTWRYWVQPFGVLVYFAGRGGTAISTDKRINRVRSDIEKRIGVELANGVGPQKLCNSLADMIWLRGPQLEIDTDRNLTVLWMTIAIRYTVSATDPYTQPS